MLTRISKRGSVLPSVGPSVCNQLFSKSKNEWFSSCMSSEAQVQHKSRKLHPRIVKRGPIRLMKSGRSGFRTESEIVIRTLN